MHRNEKLLRDTKLLRDRLNKLKRQMSVPEHVIPAHFSDRGICWYAHKDADLLHTLHGIFPLWPKVSKTCSTGFPVPAPPNQWGFEASLAFMSEDMHNWKGEYGALRRELLVFTLAELSKIIAVLRNELCEQHAKS